MRKTHFAVLGVTFALSTLVVGTARAQDQPPPTRIVAATYFEVPFGQERADFVNFLTEYFLPGYQLNPNVKNFRMLTHNWGSNASSMLLVAEYESFADIEADCGQPCEDYFAQHEAPEEGEAGYDEYQRKLVTFNKYYANHSDEIYSTNMNRAVVEGQMQGQVGPAPSEN